jgi:hypothetical protein
MLLIGSVALQNLGINIERKPRDVDLVGRPNDVYALLRRLKAANNIRAAYPIQDGKKYFLVTRENDTIYEIEMAWDGSTGADLLELVDGDNPDIVDVLGMTMQQPSLSVLHALKLSHRYLRNSPHFLKTMSDIHRIRKMAVMENLDLTMGPELKAWFKKREDATYWYKHPSLKTSKADFFKGDGVDYVYDHDAIHVVMQHLDEPAYKRFQAEEAEVECSKDKFYALDVQTRLYSVLEEVQVLALERSQVPFHRTPDPRWSFNKAHEKVCTSITSGWWREFAWENYHAVQKMYEPDYADRFFAQADAGKVKAYDPSKGKY